MQEEKWHPPKGDGNMSELIYKLQSDVSEIRGEQVDMKVEQAILKETQSLTNGYIEKSINALTENLKVLSSMFSEMKENNNRMERQFQLDKQRFEMEVNQIKNCNKEQNEEIKKISIKDKVGLWWSDPLSKFSTGVVGILLLWLASKFGVPVDSITK